MVVTEIVRLVREGRLPNRERLSAKRWARIDGEWVETEPPPTADDILDDAQQQLLLQEEVRAELDRWGDPSEADRLLQDLMDEFLHPRRGDRGLTARSRMNMRRLFVSLPWELVGPRPALISLTYPKVWQPWVIDGRAWKSTTERSSAPGSAAGRNLWSAYG